MPGEPDNSKGALSSAPFLILAWAGLAGAAGVALAAAAAHTALATAATMLMLHAGAAVAIAAVGMRVVQARLWDTAALLMLVGVSLFSGEIAYHTFADNGAFQILAPVGGTLMIVSWLCVASVAIAGWLRG